MSLTLITITPANAAWAVNENFRRIYAEIPNKLPARGIAILEGNLNFGGTFTIRGLSPNGPRSALCRAPYVSDNPP